MQEVLITITVNPITLTTELQAEWPTAGVKWDGSNVWAIMPDTFDQPTYDAILAAHDPNVLTPDQAEEEDAEDARATLRSLIPDRVIWHLDNPATTGNAVQVLGRMQTEWVLFMRYLYHQLRA